jgi:hypothetical protein
VKKLSAHRIAITHSEPDNGRIKATNDALMSGEIITLARDLRSVAHWLWQGETPAFARDIDKPVP